MSLVGLCSVIVAFPRSSTFVCVVVVCLFYVFWICFVFSVIVSMFLSTNMLNNVLTLSAIELILKRLPPICSQND